MHVLVLALLIGIVTGLRAFTGPAAVAWSARSGPLILAGTRLSFLGSAWCVWIFTALAVFELINDQLPKTPSRTVPAQFIPRVLLGGFCGAALGLPFGSLWVGVVAGAIGAVIGTLGGASARAKLSAAFGRDLPAALLEDLVAIVSAWLIVTHL